MDQRPYQTPHQRYTEGKKQMKRKKNKQTQRCFTTYVIQEMQIKITVKYYHILIGIATNYNTDNNKF